MVEESTLSLGEECSGTEQASVEIEGGGAVLSEKKGRTGGARQSARRSALTETDQKRLLY